jgi:multiple sugar transport system permease protein/putative aldouronate transport system permease protein
VRIEERSDRLFYAFVGTFMFIIMVLVLYPLIYILSSSFSSTQAISQGRVVLFPVEPSLDGYYTVFSYSSVLTGYRNTIFYTLIGTFTNVTLTLFCAYPLSRKDLPFRNTIMLLFTFTMYFGGGLIPSYMLMRSLRLIDKFAAVILPGALSVYNLIIARTFIQNSIPKEIYDAALIDGCSDFRYFISMILPLAKALIAVLILYYAVGHWNAWFDSFIYLNNSELYPLQLILRDILIINRVDPGMVIDAETRRQLLGRAELMKFSLIVVSSVPVMCLYPFVQKYFVQGVMIGATKG